jgi:hypothetical protein
MTELITAIKTAAEVILSLFLVHFLVNHICGMPPHIIFISLLRVIAQANSVWFAIRTVLYVLLLIPCSFYIAGVLVSIVKYISERLSLTSMFILLAVNIAIKIALTPPIH